MTWSPSDPFLENTGLFSRISNVLEKDISHLLTFSNLKTRK